MRNKIIYISLILIISAIMVMGFKFYQPNKTILGFDASNERKKGVEERIVVQDVDGKEKTSKTVNNADEYAELENLIDKIADQTKGEK